MNFSELEYTIKLNSYSYALVLITSLFISSKSLKGVPV